MKISNCLQTKNLHHRAAILAGSFGFLGTAGAETIFSENFDGLKLGPFVSATEIAPADDQFTSTPPVGWIKENGTTPAGNPVEFYGFNFLNKDAWVSTAGNQDRDKFLIGSGTVMVADPDEYDDGTNIDPEAFDAFIKTPVINLAGFNLNTLKLNFDSSFRPYDVMTAQVDVAFNGGEWKNLFAWNSANTGGDSSLTRVSESQSIDLSSIASGSNMQVRFGLTKGGNDWWWAVDNVAITADMNASASPAGPIPLVPEGGKAPGAFPNTSVSAVNVIAKGSSTVFNSSVEVSSLDGQGPIPWAVNRYNRGDFAMRLAPANPVAALSNLGQGFSEFANPGSDLPANQSWRPNRNLGVVIPSARQNGPINWNDGEGPFFPTVAIAWSSSGPSYNMLDGTFATGDLDINTGRAGTHASSPEANFAFSTAWFPYDQGWIGGDVGTPIVGDPNGIPDGTAQWSRPNAHSAGITAGMIRWIGTAAGSPGGVAEVILPGINTLEDGMLFATSSNGNSDVNIVGVLPKADGAGWLVTIREDSETTAEVLAADAQSQFQFVYVPLNASHLVGGHIIGSTGAKRKASGDFSMVRRSAGVYEMTIPGKTGSSGALILQAADVEAGTVDLLATRAFLSYEYLDGKFVIQSRKTTTDTTAALTDASFYAAWVDFTNPPAMPAGPRFRSQDAVAVTAPDVIALEAGIAAHGTKPEVLVTTIDSTNAGGWLVPETQRPAQQALVGRFYDPRNLSPISETFLIIANPAGPITRHDVKFNQLSNQYVVAANTRARSTVAGIHVVTLALVNSGLVVDPQGHVTTTVIHNPDADANYDDVALAVSSKNGNILLLAEHNYAGEGEGVIGMLFGRDLAPLLAQEARIDKLQSTGDEDDPDVIYLPSQDVFLYTGNTDLSTGALQNRIVASVIQTNPIPNQAEPPEGTLAVTVEQVISDGLPAARAEGHPATVYNPFTRQLITAYDAGNGTSVGDLSFFNLGTSPGYQLTSASPETGYLAGADGNPFKHQHPQMAVDPATGVILVGFNARESTIGLPGGYAYIALGPDGKALSSPFPLPAFLADAPGGLNTSANFHSVRYSPASGSFLAVFASDQKTTYLASLKVISSHLPATGQPPVLDIANQAGSAVLSWSAAAGAGYGLQSSPNLLQATWQPVPGTPVEVAGVLSLTVPTNDGPRFFRLAKP